MCARCYRVRRRSPIFHLPDATHRFRGGESRAKRGRGAVYEASPVRGLLAGTRRGLVILRSSAACLPLASSPILYVPIYEIRVETQPTVTLRRTDLAPRSPSPYELAQTLNAPWNRLLLTLSSSAVRTSNPGYGGFGLVFRPMRRRSAELTWSLH